MEFVPGTGLIASITKLLWLILLKRLEIQNVGINKLKVFFIIYNVTKQKGPYVKINV